MCLKIFCKSNEQLCRLKCAIFKMILARWYFCWCCISLHTNFVEKLTIRLCSAGSNKSIAGHLLNDPGVPKYIYYNIYIIKAQAAGWTACEYSKVSHTATVHSIEIQI